MGEVWECEGCWEAGRVCGGCTNDMQMVGGGGGDVGVDDRVTRGRVTQVGVEGGMYTPTTPTPLLIILLYLVDQNDEYIE